MPYCVAIGKSNKEARTADRTSKMHVASKRKTPRLAGASFRKRNAISTKYYRCGLVGVVVGVLVGAAGLGAGFAGAGAAFTG